MREQQHDCNEPKSNKWPLTPLISAADVPTRLRPRVQLPEGRYYALESHGRRRAEHCSYGTLDRHRQGILGEGAYGEYVGRGSCVDTSLYKRGDGGFDLRYNGHRVDVKTIGQGYKEPALLVHQHQQLRADYYVVVEHCGGTSFRLIGYAPRQFVANAPKVTVNGETFHWVPQEDLFPFPLYLQPRTAS